MVPVLIVSPAYLAGAIPLGSLMQAALAFTRVEGAFAFCISPIRKIAEWKAMVDRLAGFEDAMIAVDESRAQTRRAIVVVSRNGGRDLDLSGLSIRLPDGSDDLRACRTWRFKPGDRLMIAGPSGSGKSTLFRALAGLWPSGSGRVEFPEGRRGAGDAAAALFPARHAAARRWPIRSRAERGAGRRHRRGAGDGRPAASVPRLDEEADWNVLLSGGEQQRVGIARALIRKPTVLLFDEPVAALADASGRELYLTLLEKLPDAVVMTIDRREVLREYHPKIVELIAGCERDAAGPALSRPLGNPAGLS